MRRNTQRMPSQHGQQSIIKGPLMTNHLQELDLELELLKRKRQIIEQQQQMLMPNQNDRQRQYGFDQAPLHLDDYNQQDNRNFSYLYNDLPAQSSRKRPNISPWQHDSEPKRFSGPNPNNAKNSLRGHWTNIPPLMPQIKSFRRPPPPSRKPQNDFNPRKVNKPKPRPSSNKLNSYPVNKRKQLVDTASEVVNYNNSSESQVLSADGIPSQRMTGRLELALGNILKAMKETYGEKDPYKSLFISHNYSRVIKQGIRERIRKVMIGKVVDNVDDIVNNYRQAYPKATDIDILHSTLDEKEFAGQNKTGVKAEAADPKKYFSYNIHKLLSRKLEEMFGTLQEIYGNNDDKSVREKIDLKIKQESKSEVPAEVSKGNNENQHEKVENHDDKVQTEENQQKNVDINVENNEKTKVDGNKKENYTNVELQSESKIENFMRKKLPSMLLRYVPHIISLINNDEVYKQAKKDIIDETKSMIVKNYGPKNAQDINKPSDTVTSDPFKARSLYFVKIFGRPSLPKRNIMQEFLDKFEPKSIKRHKNVHSLLFVGFATQENHDNIIAAHGTVLGKTTLEIKSNEKITTTTSDEQSKSQEIVTDDSTLGGDDSGLIINSELDCQINDLLTSIRKSEEEEKEVKRDLPNDSNVQEESEVVEVENSESTLLTQSTTDADTDNQTITIQDEEVAKHTNEEGAKHTNEEGAKQTNEEGEKQTTEVVKEDKVLETIAEQEEAIEDPVVEEQKPAETAAVNKIMEAVNNEANPKGTPTRASARLANSTPSTIKTRRSSKILQ